jgi:intein/homing endonuclease
MQEEVAKLYEKLTVLRFAHENFEDAIPTIGQDSSFFDMLDSAFNNKVSDTVEVENKVYVNVDDHENEEIVEPLMEKIKNMVALMPENPESEGVAVETAISDRAVSITFEDISADFENLPDFEPIETPEKATNGSGKQSLNEKLNKGKQLQIGLNDKLAFIKHLFDGDMDDYNRVVSQLTTVKSFDEAKNLINTMIKPDYNNWFGKEEYEARLLEILEARFN